MGVIGVAVFRERQAPPAYTPPEISAVPPPSALDRADASAKAEESRGQSSGFALPAPAAPAPRNEQKLGTGHGEREYSYVNHAEFERLQSEPNEVVRIRYDSLDNLIAMGVVRGPRPGPLAANPFPSSPDRGYVPDPP